MLYSKRSPAKTVLHCTMCGREIIRGEEYWVCNGSQVCAACFPELARRELAPCRDICGKELRR